MTASQATDTTTDIPRYEIRFPSPASVGLAQDEEWCQVALPGAGERRIRFHDYTEIYPHPGLYEQIFHDRLECDSPAMVIGLLAERLRVDGVDPRALTALDLGAGNGLVGEQLRRIGIGEIVGIDSIEEAGAAAHRDRPGLYAGYVVDDLCAPTPDTERQLARSGAQVLACISALGFGAVPALAFGTAYDMVDRDGWLAFNIRDTPLDGGDSPFAELIGDLRDSGCIEIIASERYVHRLSSVDGEPLHYVATVARKRDGASARGRARTL